MVNKTLQILEFLNDNKGWQTIETFFGKDYPYQTDETFQDAIEHCLKGKLIEVKLGTGVIKPPLGIYSSNKKTSIKPPKYNPLIAKIMPAGELFIRESNKSDVQNTIIGGDGSIQNIGSTFNMENSQVNLKNKNPNESQLGRLIANRTLFWTVIGALATITGIIVTYLLTKGKL